MTTTVHKKNQGNKRLKAALLRALIALLVGLVLLTVSGFSFVDLLRGAESVTELGEETVGSFVRMNVDNILGYYAEDVSTADDTTVQGRYAVVSYGSMLVTVHLPERYLDSGDIIRTETEDYFAGNRRVLDHYFLVSGTVKETPEDLLTTYYSWYEENQYDLYTAGAVNYSNDYATVLSDYMLEVDALGSMNITLATVLSAVAGLCLLYMIVELVLAAAGRYDSKAAEAVEGEEGAEDEASEEADAEAEKTEEAEEETAPEVAEVVSEEEAAEEEAEETEEAENAEDE